MTERRTRDQVSRSAIVRKFESFLEGRNIAHLCRRDGQPRFVVYAFRRPRSKAYERNRLAARHFEWIARLIEEQPAAVRFDYVLRGGVVATKGSLSAEAKAS
jgi:hypothetical protein